MSSNKLFRLFQTTFFEHYFVSFHGFVFLHQHYSSSSITINSNRERILRPFFSDCLSNIRSSQFCQTFVNSHGIVQKRILIFCEILSERVLLLQSSLSTASSSYYQKQEMRTYFSFFLRSNEIRQNDIIKAKKMFSAMFQSFNHRFQLSSIDPKSYQCPSKSISIYNILFTMFNRSYTLILVLFITLSVCTHSLRSNHDKPACPAGEKRIIVVDHNHAEHLLIAKIPQRNDWQWLYVQSRPPVMGVDEGYSACFLLEDKTLYISGRAGWVLPNNIVDNNDWEKAFVGSSGYIAKNYKRYFGSIVTQACQEPGYVKFRCEQVIGSITHLSYLVGLDSRAKFVGTGLLRNYIEQDYCYRFA